MSTLQRHDVEHHQPRIGFHFRRWGEQFGNEQRSAVRQCVLQEAILLVQGLPFEVHLGDQFIVMARKPKMNVRRSYGVRSCWVSSRFYRFKLIPALGISFEIRNYLTILVER